jgi:hypothetical protein
MSEREWEPRQAASLRVRWDYILRQSLTQALETATSEDALEIAILAGLLTRLDPEEVDMKAWAWRDQARLALAHISVDHFVDRLALCDGDAIDPSTLDALFALDEVCAAACWLGVESVALRDAVDLVSRMVYAFPEPWVGMSENASSQMACLDPKDPSRPLWRTIEATQWYTTELQE